jgi:tetratricopeptide (TPR) repeat protein
VHAWSGLFLELLTALQMFFADARNRVIAPPVMWIDLFCEDQHVTDRPTGETIQALVLPAMRSCSRVIFVPGAWKRSVALHRTWCLFELSRAHAHSLPVFLALVPAQRVIFLRFIDELGSHKDFADAVGRAQLLQSKSTRGDDHAWLLQELAQSPGAAALEQCIADVLRGWLLLQLQQQLASSLAAAQDVPTTTKWMILIGELLADAGDKGAAVSMFQDALQRLHSFFGPRHARTISCSWELAKLLIKLERYSDSLPLLTHCFETKKELLGASNDSVLTVQHTLASVLATLRQYAIFSMHPTFRYHFPARFESAETLFVVSLTSLKQLYGDNHVRTAAAAAALADLYSKMGKMAQAVKFYRQALSLCNGSPVPPFCRSCAPRCREAASAFATLLGQADAQTLKINV